EGVPAAAEVISADNLESPIAKIIYRRCCELSHSGVTPEFDRLLLEFDEPAIKNLLVDLDEYGRAKTGVEPAARLRDLLAALARHQQHRSLDQHARVLQERRLDAAEELALLQQLIEQERTRQGISSPMEG